MISKKHIKGIMLSKGYSFLGSVLGSSISSSKRVGVSPTSKYMTFKKPGVPGYVFISAKGHVVKPAPSAMVYKRPIRGGGYKCRYKLLGYSICSPFGLYKIL